jgi:tetratricopeptide (TPR) repeat protein
VRHYDLSEWEPALIDFKEAYRNKPDPAFLYNIAQCHRKLGHANDAITFYQSYLRRAPNAGNREEVERRIAEIEPLRPAGLATTGAAAPGGPAGLDLRAHDETAAKPSSPLVSRWWFWTAVGAVAAGTATLAIILARRDPTQIPSSGLGAQKALP